MEEFRDPQVSILAKPNEFRGPLVSFKKAERISGSRIFFRKVERILGPQNVIFFYKQKM